jgi:cAMP-dependent protein kinase regulator
MDEKKVNKGDFVIREGEDGDCLYVIEQGSYKCTKVFKGNKEPTYLKTYQPGEAFGELALLYNAPRAATIFADEPGVLYVLDRNTFNHIVKDAAAKKRERYEEFLSKVKILKTMDAYERSKLSDALKNLHFEAGETVILEGDSGDDFYFIEKGNAIATKTVEAGKAPIEVMRYESGDYFGERALINNAPRAANVIATTELDVVTIDRHSFK